MAKVRADRGVREAYDVEAVFRGESSLGFDAEEDYAEYLHIIETAIRGSSGLETPDEIVPYPPATPTPSARHLASRVVSRGIRKRRSANR